MPSVLLVDNHEVVCEGLRAMLVEEGTINVVGVANNGRQAIKMTQQLKPDVVVMDVRMPVLDGVSACREIRKTFQAPQVLMLSTYDDDKDVFDAIDAGAAGFMIKDMSTQELINAIGTVAKGRSFFHPIVSKKIADKVRGISSREKARFRLIADLTPREMEILMHISHGASNADIATALFLSEGTVKSHVSNILRKLGKRDRTQLALFALEQGLN